MQDVVSLFVTLFFFVFVFVCFLLLLLVTFLVSFFFFFFFPALVVPFPKSCHISCDRLGVSFVWW